MASSLLVVGAGSGLGRAIIGQSLAAGYAVTATVSSPEGIAPLADALPGCTRIVVADLADAKTARATISAVAGAIGERLGAVLVCAAVSPFEPAETMPLDTLRRTLEINLVSHLAIYQAVLPTLRRSGGRLLFTGSLSGRFATPLMAAYCASKFALEGLVDVMRQEAGAFGVRVLLLQPGTFDTPALARAAEALAAIPAGAERYADLYRNTAARVAQARDTGAMLPAEVVAAAALAAIAAPSPDARCPVGEDAHALITATKTLSDAALDALALGLGDAELEREIRNDQ